MFLFIYGHVFHQRCFVLFQGHEAEQKRLLLCSSVFGQNQTKQAHFQCGPDVYLNSELAVNSDTV